MAKPDYEDYARELDAEARRRREEERRRAWPELYEGEQRKRIVTLRTERDLLLSSKGEVP